jgi:hypothetical protein
MPVVWLPGPGAGGRAPAAQSQCLGLDDSKLARSESGSVIFNYLTREVTSAAAGLTCQ